MEKIKKFKKSIPILIGLILIFSSLGDLKVFAAVDSGFNSPSIKTYSGINPNNTIDSDMSTYGYVYNGRNFVYNIPSYASTFRVYAKNTDYFGDNFAVEFLNDSGAIINSPIYQGIKGTGNGGTLTSFDFSVPIGAVAALVTFTASSALNIYEVEYNASIVHTEISNLTATPGNNNVLLSWDDLSGNKGLTGYKVYRNDSLLTSLGSTTHSFNDTGLNINTSYTYKVTALYADGQETTGVTQTVKTLNPPAGEVSLLSAVTKKNEVDLSWENPTDSLFGNQVNIYRDGVKIGESTGTTFTDPNVNPGTGYNYTVKTMSIYGAESKGTSLIVATSLDEVGNVNAVPNWNNVALSWDNPNDPLFAGVSIYRDGVKIGESTGTTYTDSSVNPETKYTYTIKVLSTNLTETDGISFQTTTLKEPLPVLTGATGTKTDNGDFLFTWDTPITGTVKVLVGGTLYKTVDAGLQKIIIPSSDMKYNVVGNPEVTLVPVSTTGLEGKTYNPDTASIDTRLPIGANNLLETGKSLLWIIAPLLLLSLAFLLVPKLRNLMLGAIKGKKMEEETTRRTENDNEQQKENLEENERLVKTTSKNKKEKRNEKDIREERLPRELRKELEERELKRQLNGEVIKSDKPEKESRVKAPNRLRQPRARIREGRISQRQKRESRESTRIPREPRRRNQ